MNECIKKLNELEIYPLYVFDALLVKITDQEVTKKIMDTVVKEMGIYTTSKVNLH